MKGDSSPTRADVCVVACAEAFRGDGEILGAPIGNLPVIGGRLARATFEPDLVMTDTEALLVANTQPVGGGAGTDIGVEGIVVEGWLPFRTIFDVVWSGRRHVMMGASQIDQYGNQNIACIGEWARPQVQLLGVRGAPGNTISHATSYWVPKHTPRSFVEKVDFVCGIGYDRAGALDPQTRRFHEIRRVVSNLGTFDFETDSHRMRLRTLHPGVSVDDVVTATGFDLAIPDEVAETRPPTAEDLELIRDVIDPDGLREREVPG